MTAAVTTRRPGLVSMVMIVASIGLSVGLSLALDWFVFSTPNASLGAPALVLPFNATVILMSVVGAVIEWRRPGHAIGRLLMLSGPLYATLFIGWTVADYSFAPLIDPRRLCRALLGDGDPLLPGGRALCRLAAPALPDGNPAWPSVAPTGRGTRRRYRASA